MALVKRHNWTYRDLGAVCREAVPRAEAYPLEREQDLAAYCSNVLGLRKHGGTPGKSHPNGKPEGLDVALRLCRREPGSEVS